VFAALALACIYRYRKIMQEAMEKTITEKRKRGRPATGLGELIGVRIQPDLLARVDEYRLAQNPEQTRPEAIRALLDEALAENGIA
jgi:uncharacterized protein (DUF4415 family)